MKRISDFDRSHPETVDELFHILDTSAVGRVLYWHFFFDLIRDVPGTIVECGVGRGRSLLIISALNVLSERREGGLRDIWGFDSFAGFDEPSRQDNSNRNPKKGEWARSPSGAYEYAPDFVRKVLQEARADSPGLKLVKGYFNDTLPSYLGGPIALLNIDCDLYKPYKYALEYLFDKVVPGGVIVFDDFKIEQNANEHFPGARKAVYEFFGNKVSDLKESLKGNPYYVKPSTSSCQ